MRALQVFLNPAAAQGRARERFRAVEDGLWKGGVPFDLHEVGAEDLPARVRAALDEGLPDLVAAGGDGTVNALLAAIMELSPPERRRVTLGAIALGSSNDFHKPVDPDSWFRRVPVALRPEDAYPRHVFELETDAGNLPYLMNSSAGLLARGNHWFNHPPLVLRLLQRLHYGLSVQLMSLVNVLTHRGVKAVVEVGDRRLEGLFDGITVLKGPHVAADIVFRTLRSFGDGLFDVICLHKVPPGELPGVLKSLAEKGPEATPQAELLQGEEVRLSFERPERVEYDGETVEVTRARYRILPDAVRLMGRGVPL